MNIYDLEKLATSGPWEVSKEGDAWLPGEVFVKGRKSVGCCWEQANTDFVVHCRNHFMEALAALKTCRDTAALEHTKADERHPSRSGLSKLIAKLEEVK